MDQQPQKQVEWGKIILAAGLAVFGALGMMLWAKVAGQPTTSSSASIAQPEADAAVEDVPHRAAAQPEPRCEARIAVDAMLRQRASGAAYAGRAIRMLEMFNGLPADSIQVLGWAAESSDEGPPCFATFTYVTADVRHTARFKFWPGPPARLATANEEAGSMADLVDGSGASGVVPTQAQLALASLMRVGHGVYSEDAYMAPREPNVLLVRRQHCLAGNVGGPDDEGSARTWFRMMRRAHIARIQCVADNAWTQDIPTHGRVPPPYLADSDGGI